MSKKIKNEQKKFLGETLNQYDKALDEAINQLDKKNREQNHKISSLTNSFDNEYLEKDVEGNMTTLENSKDGMVIINEIQGSTEVNYCKDGEKELILNGDIDTQGESFVTLTEGVDGGLVDVSLEGNTEINLSKTKDPVLVTREFDDINCNVGKLQYTIDDVTTVNDEPGKVDIDRIVGDTMVNHAVNGNEELILNGDIDTSGDNFITIDTGAEGGKVDVVLEGNTLVNVSKTKDTTPITRKGEDAIGNHIALVDEGSMRPVLNGNTMVNVCDQKDPVAITKSYTVETGNHVALQGEYDGKCRPVVTGNTLVNLVSSMNSSAGSILEGDLYSINCNIDYPNVIFNLAYNLKPGNTYTILINIKELVEGVSLYIGGTSSNELPLIDKLHTNSTGFKILPITIPNDKTDNTLLPIWAEAIGVSEGKIYISKPIILEGDYTNKPIPEYFEGLQSSFEDNLVTQEMVDAGEELAENLGKYKVDYVVTGKNKFDGNILHGKTINSSGIMSDDSVYAVSANYIHIRPNTIYTSNANSQFIVYYYDNNFNYVTRDVSGNITFTTLSNAEYIKFRIKETDSNISNIQIEEGTTSTSYEPYKEYKKTFYLNSPLLEGDTIEQQGDNVVHVHRSELRPYQTGDELTLPTDMTNTLVAKASPTYEVISQNDTILCDSYVNGYLDVDSIVPIEKVKFNAFAGWANYLYPSTEYIVQFESDNVGKISYIGLNWKAYCGGKNVVKGINKFRVLIDSTINSGFFECSGIGFSASNIVITPAIEQDFDYFEGLQSSFEDNLVTEGENAGKYEVTYKVTGKNKLNLPQTYTREMKFTDRNVGYRIAYYKLEPNKDYILTGNYSKSIEELGHGGIDISLFEDIPLDIDTWYLSQPNEKRLFWSEYYSVNLNYKFNSEGYKYVGVYIGIATGIAHNHVATVSNLQLEEGSVATPYEPYKEYTKTLYLNSPLLEGDTIEEKDGNIYHVHRYRKLEIPTNLNWRLEGGVVGDSLISFIIGWYSDTKVSGNIITDKFKTITTNNTEGIRFVNSNTQIIIAKSKLTTEDSNGLNAYLQQNPLTVVYELASPQYELIQQSGTIAIPSYSSGHLDITSAVPLDKVNFLHFEEELTYLYPSTSYTIQFSSDRNTTADVNLGGTQLLAQSIVKGLNRISITTPETLVDNKLIIDGVRANIKEVVVTDSNRNFGYFEGMKSVGECEDLEVKSNNKNLFDIELWKSNPIFKDRGDIVWNGDDFTVTAIVDDCWGATGVTSGNPYEDYMEKYLIKVKPNTKYTISFNRDSNANGFTTYACFYAKDRTFIKLVQMLNTKITIQSPNNAFYMGFRVGVRGIGNYATYSNIQIEEHGEKTTYEKYQSNTQHLTHEPLRAVGEVKDRYVLIDGKWYIERKCGYNDVHHYSLVNTDTTRGIAVYFENRKSNTICLCDSSKFEWGFKPGTFYPNPSNIVIVFDKNDPITDEDMIAKVSQYNFIYQLETPIYEQIDYNPLETYLDTTHISTNSTIPTNITVKNHGYNMVALKENTQYTLYVNKDTTNALTYRLGDYVEINSQSKFTFTTPSTLTDKTLRIDGKGNSIKDLMLIEGTPANDPVGYFDGLKSSYECERVTDESDENYGKYKVETIVRGKNLFDVNNANYVEGFIAVAGTIRNASTVNTYYIKCLPNTKYTISKIAGKYFRVNTTDSIPYIGINTLQELNENATSSSISITTHQYAKYLVFNIHDIGIDTITESDMLNSVQIEQGDTATEYEPYFESKQTVYLNSPLLKDDEIVWKDNKIQHYHKMNRVVLDGSESWMCADGQSTGNTYLFRLPIANTSMRDSGTSSPYTETVFCDNMKVHLSGMWTDYNNESICVQDDNIIDVRLSKSKLNVDSSKKYPEVYAFKQYLQQNPIIVVYKIATPYYEEISDYPLKFSTKENCSLTTESNIQVTQISFNIYEETLAYLYPSTKYYVSFNADISREIVINLGGTEYRMTTQVGYNKIEITTPADTTNMLTFNGQGINIDHVMVTRQDIDEYFEGMKSVGECENNTLEIICKNNDNSKSNTQTLTHEPLRAVEDIKDRYVLIDGKWYIERNCREMIITSEDISGIGLMEQDLNNGYERYSLSFHSMTNYRAKRPYQKLLNNSFYSQVGWKFEGECMFLNEDNSIGLILNKNRNIGNNHNKLREFLTNNPVKFIYELASPIYEEINYNPFEVYSDVTHITINSLIPTNMVIKNHGYNCILKPSTKYTVALNKPNGTISAKLGGSEKVDSTNSVFTITTPSTLNDNVLRLSGSGNVKDIMILEGDKTVNTPSYFEGIESVFEQEYDTEKGKYRVTARVEGNGKESSIIFYLNEPLRGTDTVKDKVFIQDGKVVVQRNCGSVTFDGSEEGWGRQEDKGKFIKFSKEFIDFKYYPYGSHKLYCDTLCTNTNIVETDLEQLTLFCHNENMKELRFNLSKAKLSQLNIEGFKQWLQQNPTTVVYELQEPTYEEADCDLSKLVLENYENSSLIFESNIPVSANIRYSGEVPVVTQAKSLSSQVDNTTLDINENIIPYMCDIDYRIVELQLMNGDTQGEDIELLGIGDIEILGNENVLFNNREDKKHNFSYDMLKRDILSQRYSREEYQYRLDRYLLANKISDEEYKELEGLLNNGE